MQVTAKHVSLIKHALGLDRSKKSYRNYFSAGEDSSDYQDLEELVANGLMSKCTNRLDEMSTSFIYSVTKEGIETIK